MRKMSLLPLLTVDDSVETDTGAQFQLVNEPKKTSESSRTYK